MSTLTNWRRHSPYHRRYGRDGGKPSKLGRGGKIAIVGTALAVGGIAFFMSRKASAATPAPSPEPVVPPSPGVPVNQPPAAPPMTQGGVLARVATHDPPPAGDLNVFNAPNGSRIGGAEKNSLVHVLSNDGTWAQIETRNTEGRLVDVTGFVHAKFLTDPDAAQVGTEALSDVSDALDQVQGLFGF